MTTHPPTYTMDDVLTPTEVITLSCLCDEARVGSRDMWLQNLNDLGRVRHTDIVVAALGGCPEDTEAMLVGAEVRPNTRERLQRHMPYRTHEALRDQEDTERAAKRAAAAAARQRAASSPCLPRQSAEPRGWIDHVRQSAVSIRDIAPALGYVLAGRSGGMVGLSPCPACREERRGSHDKRPPALVRSDGQGWRCYRCDASGDAIGIVTYTICGQRRWSSPEQRREVARWFVVQGWLK